MSKSVNTILTITIIALMAVLLIYGYCATQKLDETKPVKVVSSITKHINYKEENPNDPEISETNENSPPEDEDFEPFVEVVDDEYTEQPVEEEVVIKIPEPVPSSKAAIPDSPFLVIAGSFQSRKNAETKVQQLKKKGIDAEIVHLHNSELNAICIARSQTEQQATDTMTTMKTRHNIKAYVYKKP